MVWGVIAWVSGLGFGAYRLVLGVQAQGSRVRSLGFSFGRLIFIDLAREARQVAFLLKCEPLFGTWH